MNTVDTLLTRGVEKIYPSKEALEKVLLSGKKLRLYQGFDPTGINLHIGHFVGLMKLRQFQKAGHEVIFLIGDGTGQAGDPSGKTRAREKYLTNQELRKNAKDYVMQAKRIVDFNGNNPVKIMYNGDWLNKLQLADILNITGYFTLQQFLERDLYQERIKSGQFLSLREFLYPLLQAYDSVAMNVDLEIGGSDQTFNMLMGRHLVSGMKKREKFVLTTPLLTDNSGKKIGKTEGNAIAISDKPQDLYAKIMSLPDDVITKSFEYLTEIPTDEIEVMNRKIQKGENPMQFKKRLAFEIVKLLNSEKEAQDAQTFFEQVHQQKQTETLQNVTDIIGQGLFVRDVIANNLSISASETKRLITQNAVDVNGKIITDSKKVLKSGEILRVGKKHIFKVK